MSSFDSCAAYYSTTTPFPASIPKITGNMDRDRLRTCLGIQLSTQVPYTDLSIWNTDVNAIAGSGASCSDRIGNHVYATGYSQTAHQDATDGVAHAWSVYNQLGGRLVPPGQTGYYPILDTLMTYCDDASNGRVAGVCASAQSKICDTCSSSQIGSSSTSSLIKFCGCYVPMDTLSTNNNIPSECNPLCARDTVSHKVDIATGAPIRCKDAVCVINDITISSNLADQGNITFFQACPQCQDSNGLGICRCIIDTSIAGIGTKLGLDDPVSYSQYCGTNSICLAVDSATGLSTQVNCVETLSSVKPKTYSFPIPRVFIILAVAIIIVGVLVSLSALYASNKTTVSKPGLYKGTEIPVNVNIKGVSSSNFKSVLSAQG